MKRRIISLNLELSPIPFHFINMLLPPSQTRHRLLDKMYTVRVYMYMMYPRYSLQGMNEFVQFCESWFVFIPRDLRKLLFLLIVIRKNYFHRFSMTSPPFFSNDNFNFIIIWSLSKLGTTGILTWQEPSFWVRSSIITPVSCKLKSWPSSDLKSFNLIYQSMCEWKSCYLNRLNSLSI